MFNCPMSFSIHCQPLGSSLCGFFPSEDPESPLPQVHPGRKRVFLHVSVPLGLKGESKDTG